MACDNRCWASRFFLQRYDLAFAACGIGDAIFLINGDRGASPVMFGEKGDSTLLGTVSLEALGLVLDPIKRVLRPLPLLLEGSPR